MGYAIVGGAGLCVGIGLMIWALSERSKRHKAERAADDAKAGKEKMRKMAMQNAVVTEGLRAACQRTDKQLEVLRQRLKETRTRLAQTGDPEAVKAWLDDELKGGPV